MSAANNQNTSSEAAGPGSPESSNFATFSNASGDHQNQDTHASSHFGHAEFNFQATPYLQNGPAGSGYTPQRDYHYSYHQHGGAPFAPPGLRLPVIDTPASRPRPRPIQRSQDHLLTPTNPSEYVSHQPRMVLPSFTLQKNYGPEAPLQYNPPAPHHPLPPPPPPPPASVDSDDDEFPVALSQPSQKAQGKKPTKTKKKHAETPDVPVKKKLAARASTAKQPKAKVEEDVKPPKGRQQGAKNFTLEESLQLLDLVRGRLPIGSASWDAVARDYSIWAKKNGFPERDRKSVKAKFESLAKTAKSKPTGSADRDPLTNPLAIALTIEAEIDAKGGTLTVHDSEFEEYVDDKAASDDVSVIELSDDDAKKSVQSSVKKEAAKDTVLTRAYRTAEPLADNLRRSRPRVGAATEALSSLTNAFNPSIMRERDEARMSQSLHLTQITSLQNEMREVRGRVEHLQERLADETRRADRAESQVALLTALQQQAQSQSRGRRRRRRRSPTSDEDSSDSHSEFDRRSHRHRRHQKSRRTSPSPVKQRSSSSVFFGQQPSSPPQAGPSVFPGSLNALASAAAAAADAEADVQHGTSITITPRRSQKGTIYFDVTPKKS